MDTFCPVIHGKTPSQRILPAHTPGKTALEALLKKEPLYPLAANSMPGSQWTTCNMCQKQCLICSTASILHTKDGGHPFQRLHICPTKQRIQIIPCNNLHIFRMEWSHEVAKALLREIIPPFGLPLTIYSDNRPAFVVDIIQILTRSLNITQKLHTVYPPQSSGKAEPMNRTLKETLAKFHQETNLPWPYLLPLAVLHACCMPGTLPFWVTIWVASPMLRKTLRKVTPTWR